MHLADNVLRFPAQLRVVRAPADEGARPVRAPADPSLVDHDGRLYRLDALLAELSPSEAAELEAASPRTGQEMWDYVCRHWPTLATSIVAGAQPIG